MKIGIIGAGQIGGTLAAAPLRPGHDVTVANTREPHTLADLTRESGAKAVPVTEAVKGRDLIIISIPREEHRQAAEGPARRRAPARAGDRHGNYYPKQRDGHIAEIEGGLTESRWAANVLGHPVIKVFKQHLLEAPARAWRRPRCRRRIALPVAGGRCRCQGDRAQGRR